MDDRSPEQPTPERRLVERRKLVLVVDADGKPAAEGNSALSAWPRRSGVDRRRAERRAVNLVVETDRRRSVGRRANEERRTTERRRDCPERRRQGPMAFTREEAGIIVQRASQVGVPVACPRCESTLTLRPPVASEGSSVWNVHCASCRCRLRIRNL